MIYIRGHHREDCNNNIEGHINSHEDHTNSHEDCNKATRVIQIVTRIFEGEGAVELLSSIVVSQITVRVMGRV